MPDSVMPFECPRCRRMLSPDGGVCGRCATGHSDPCPGCGDFPCVCGRLRREMGLLEVRVDDAALALDQLADLLADSEDLPVNQTDAVRRLNEIIAVLQEK